ncbi:hypothetical protein J26TS2_25760 [Shouchella clausii]|nr:hypothetical protein J26TS2_25760 [Shouchella clausii]
MLRSLCRFHNVHRPYLGINTVNLSGEGFESFVKVGEKVTTGQKRLSFDLNLIKEKAKSAITPLIITNMEKVAGLQYNYGMVTTDTTVLVVHAK